MPAPRSLLIAVLAMTAAACGGDDERDVRDALERYAKAVEQKDYQALCDDVLGEELVENVQTASGKPCEIALKGSLDDVQKPTITVMSVKLDGATATAVAATDAANEDPSEDTIRLEKEDGEWKVLALGSEGA